jgi:hypothetical protein
MVDSENGRMGDARCAGYRSLQNALGCHPPASPLAPILGKTTARPSIPDKRASWEAVPKKNLETRKTPGKQGFSGGFGGFRSERETGFEPATSSLGS